MWASRAVLAVSTMADGGELDAARARDLDPGLRRGVARDSLPRGIRFTGHGSSVQGRASLLNVRGREAFGRITGRG